MAYQRGDVVLVPFPFSDLSTTKVRPAIVVSSVLYHATKLDLLLAGITSNIAAAKTKVDYVLEGWQAAGLRYPSAFKPVLFTLDPVRVLFHMGALTHGDLKQVGERLARALGLILEQN